MRTKSDSEHQFRELSKEEFDALIVSLGPIEVPEGPLTNAGEQGIITTYTFTAEELGLKNRAKRGKTCAE